MLTRSPPKEVVTKVKKANVTDEELRDFLHGDLRGDLARGVTAHAVGHDEQTLLRQQQEVVLVVVPLHSDVGLAGHFDFHGRCEAQGRERLKQTWCAT